MGQIAGEKCKMCTSPCTNDSPVLTGKELAMQQITALQQHQQQNNGATDIWKEAIAAMRTAQISQDSEDHNKPKTVELKGAGIVSSMI